ncbi:mechanosensitive ion channel family protein [Chenggangzhangella methanolivorans]|uniref:Small-conductance mechanosensitive channel n=1 Tax=Chenggangzhangella methanolivorans TaxID=1437009 RepID=A0A9E6RD50_9HYPH|nr:mechanosensitive ion channel domain-containing protein [Chenggangzhangella methanolivorans]QZO02170.1 mechanosensitive ion channel [Chenggangzhangella methanolivorans]
MPQIPIDFTFLTNLVVVYGMNVLGALLLAFVGFWVANLASAGVYRGLMASKRMDVTVASFLSSLTRYGLLAVVLIAMLQLVGIQATSLLAVLGAASLAIGLALQGTLSNMAAGVMMLLFRPFRVGDQIEVAGKAGVVKELSLFFTELATPENVKILIPNASVWGTALVNYSAYPTRRVETTVSAVNGDADATMADLASFLEQNPRALAAPAPLITKTGYGDAIELSVRAWAPANDTTALKYEIDRFVTQRRAAREAASQAAE